MSFFKKLATQHEPKKVENKDHIYFKWLRWIQKLAKRRGIESDVEFCGYGRNHLVTNPQKIGTGWMFWSKGCSGCEISARAIRALQDGTKEIPKGAPNCAFLLSSPLFTMEEVKEGQLVSIRVPYRHPNTETPRKERGPVQDIVRIVPREERQRRRGGGGGRPERPPRLVNNPNRARPVINIQEPPAHAPIPVVPQPVANAQAVLDAQIRWQNPIPVENVHFLREDVQQEEAQAEFERQLQRLRNEFRWED